MLNKNSPVPLYYQLAEIIKAEIGSGAISPGDKLPSESEMIQQYGVGRLTVRSALSQLVNQGYLEKLHGKGTFCRSALPGGSRLNIDVILDMEDAYFIPYYVKSISGVLTARNCNFILSNSKNSNAEITALLHSIREKGSSGVIVQPCYACGNAPPELVAAFDELRRAGVPYLMIDSAYDNVSGSHMVLDETWGGRLAADYLAGLGHKRMVALYVEEFKDSLQRLAGFTGQLARLGLPEAVCLPYSEAVLTGAMAAAPGGQAPTAVFCYNDHMAYECAELLHRLGYDIPGQVSVLGYDDTLIAETATPALTSIAHSKGEMGELAARVILDLISGAEPWPYTKVFEPTLVERASCAAPKTTE